MRYAHVEKSNDIAIVWLDQSDSKVNTISPAMLEEFERLLNELEQDQAVSAAVLISRKPDTFIAGADINEFLKMSEPGQGAALSRRGNALLNRIASLNKPVIAAIHGAALGGGLEVALACHFRIATNDPKTVLGQPEVRLGLLPAGGGTQRLPRLIGLQRALDLMLTGKHVYPLPAKRMGLVDLVVHPYGLLDAAKRAARDLIGKSKTRRRRRRLSEKLLEGNTLGRRLIYKKAREAVTKRTLGNYPAPLKIIDCVEAGLEKGMATGFEAEAVNFDFLMTTPQCRQLLNLFTATTAGKKNPLREHSRPVKTIGILGAGLMGAGIASVSIQKDYRVALKDVSLQALATCERAIWRELNAKVNKRALSAFDRDQIFSRLKSVVDYAGLRNADLVIEAVFEDLDLKKTVLAETEAIIGDSCIFASNTSSLPIAEIAATAKRPEQIIGMHYFSPVPKMPLLEIITTGKTADWVLATAMEVGIRQGKTVIVVKDGPGFYTTRVLAPLMNEALLVLQDGGEIKAVERAMQQLGFPVGPFTLYDEVGIDVAAHVARVMAPLFAHRGVTPSDTSQRLVDAGLKGRKSNKGFFLYDESRRRSPKKQVNLEIYGFFSGSPRREITASETQERLLLNMINEAAYCLQEEIIQSPRDGDLGAVLGLGFPPFLGGPFRYVDAHGITNVVARLDALEQKHGARFTPALILKDHATAGKSFYVN